MGQWEVLGVPGLLCPSLARRGEVCGRATLTE